MHALPVRLRRLVYGLRTEGGGAAREAAAVGLGLFIGCLPVYGLHLLLCVAVSTLFGLNRFKTYLAANISNPFVAPWLLFAEVQAGAWLRRGSWHELSIDAVKEASLRVLGLDLVAGSLAIGVSLALLGAWGTYALAGRGERDGWFETLVRRAADRYADRSITAWEFARGKLRFDPIYRALLADGVLAAGSRAGRAVVDIGCGQGLMLALLAEGRAGAWTDADAPAMPTFDRLIGVERRPHVAKLAASALGADAEIVTADASTLSVEPAGAVLFLDVLHMMPREAQVAVLRSALASLAPGGVFVIREADAGAGWRFRMVGVGNTLKAMVFGNWRQRFAFRSAAEWRALLESMGLDVEERAMGQGTPFGNVLLTATTRQID